MEAQKIQVDTKAALEINEARSIILDSKIYNKIIVINTIWN